MPLRLAFHSVKAGMEFLDRVKAELGVHIHVLTQDRESKV